MKKLLSLVLAILMVLSLASCAERSVQEEPELPQEPEITEPVEEIEENVNTYPMTLTDQAGRTVTLEAEPEKLVSGYYISTSALIALGVKDQLVGIEAKAAQRPIYTLSAPELIGLPNVGTAKEFDLEGCLALEPDLVILPLKLKSVVETLEEFGITVLLVNPETQESLEEMVTLLGDATNTSERAKELLDFIDSQETVLKTIAAETPTVYMAGNSSLLSTAGTGMYQSDMIELAGGKNAAAEITDDYWVDISYEQLLAWDPEYILLASDASYSVEDVLSDPNLAGLSAIVNGKVYQMPDKAEAWDSPVPSGILGSVWLASVLHGEDISEEQRDTVIDEFYETFYGFTYSEK